MNDNNLELYKPQIKFGNTDYTKIETQPKLTSLNPSIPIGTNNGQWGYGMQNVKIPASMNGPFGYQTYPLPYTLPLSASNDQGSYNASWANIPKRNENYFKQFLPYEKVPFGEYCLGAVGAPVQPDSE